VSVGSIIFKGVQNSPVFGDLTLLSWDAQKYSVNKNKRKMSQYGATSESSSRSNVQFPSNDMDDTPLISAADRRENLKSKRVLLAKAVFGEFLSTFIFIFVLTAAAYNYQLEPNANTSLALRMAVCSGFLAVALIYSFADVSGANFNPAVTWATWVTGKIDFLKLLLYLVAQCVGAILAVAVLMIAFPGSNIASKIIVTRGSGTELYNAFVMEMILTFILVYVIFATAFNKIEEDEQSKTEIDLEQGIDVLFDSDNITGSRTQDDRRNVSAKRTRPRLTVYTTSGTSKGAFAPIAIGFTIGFLNLVGGTVSGGCYNPARAFAPALLANKWKDQWLYWIADLSGATIAGYVQMILAQNKDVDFLILFRPLINFIKRRVFGRR
jgi:glycerol uptake facilitator-like aquaporin